MPRPADALLDVIRGWGADRLFTVPAAPRPRSWTRSSSARTSSWSSPPTRASPYRWPTGWPGSPACPASPTCTNIGLTNGLNNLYEAELA